MINSKSTSSPASKHPPKEPVDATLTASSGVLPLPHRRRDKAQLSCTLCRKRKLKCDRGQPCGTCVKRGLSLSCTYAHHGTTSDNQVKSLSRPPAYQKLQERIGQLEKLVASQVSSFSGEASSDQRSTDAGNVTNSPPSVSDHGLNGRRTSQEASGLSEPFGRIRVENNATTWVESDHWTAILDGVSELKVTLEEFHNDDASNALFPDIPDLDGPELLLGKRNLFNKNGVLAAIPSRPLVDSLVSHFFKSVETAPIVIHIPTFLSEYEQFWEEPEQTSIIWVGTLFGMMCLAMLHFDLSNELHPRYDGDGSTLAQIYRAKCSQCLILGNYTKPAPYIIEALLLYMQIEHLQSKDALTSSWILLGITIRLAVRMGYHQDPSYFPRISPFHAEIRRRVWCVLFMIDAGASTQFGLPRMIQASQSSTAEPRNLLDEDIHKDMFELPPARADTIETPVQYFVAKNRIISILVQIAELNISRRPLEYSEILRLDEALKSAYDSVPQTLKIRPMTKSIMDSSSIIINRIYVALLFYKAKCVLHRRYLVLGRSNPRYTYSRTACLEAALEVLQIQHILDQETQPGRRLCADRGKVSSVVRSDLLLATIILCVDANHSITERLSSVSQHRISDFGLSETMMNALHRAHSIWLRSSESSREAQQAARTLKGVLDRSHDIMTNTSTLSAAISASSSLTNAGSSHVGAVSERQTPTNGQPVAALPTVSADILTNDPEMFTNLPEIDFEMGEEWPLGTDGNAQVSNPNNVWPADFEWSFTDNPPRDSFA